MPAAKRAIAELFVLPDWSQQRPIVAELEAGGQDAHNRVSLAVQHDARSDCLPPSSEPLLPKRVGNNDDRRRSGLVFRHGEIPPQERLYPEYPQK
jgi:hypothetical protein